MRRSEVTKWTIVSIIVLFALASAGLCAVVRVSPTGSDVNDGSSWTAAMQTVSGALGASVYGDEIWVAAGVYVENIELVSGVGLYGGFAGNETTRQQRNWSINHSVLDGGGRGTVVDFPWDCGPDTVIDGFTVRDGMIGMVPEGAPTISHNLITGNFPSGCVAALCNCGTPYILNNVIAGNAGGGMCNCYSMVVVGNTIVGNAGLAIDAQDNPAIIENNIIAFNGGGVNGGVLATLRNNDVYNPRGSNYSGYGLSPGPGSISVDPKLAAWQYGDFHIEPDSPCRDTGWNSAPYQLSIDMDDQPRVLPTGGTVDIGAYETDGLVKTCVPVVVRVDGTAGSNANDGSSWASAKKTVQAAIDSASGSGGEVWVKAGIYTENISLKEYVSVYGGFAGSEVARNARNRVTNTTVLDGGAKDSQGHIKQYDNVVTASVITIATIDGFTIRNGYNWEGGGIYCSNATPTISHNIIAHNSSIFDGGAVACTDQSDALIQNNLIVSNSAGYSVSSGDHGGGIYCSDSSPTISCNTIAENTAAFGGGVCCDSSCSPSISDSIIAFNSSGVCNFGGSPTLSNNDIYNPSGANYTGISAGFADIQKDPDFESLQTGDFHLGLNSPCVDFGWSQADGVPTVDLDGKPRVQGWELDMGAYESDGAPWTGGQTVVFVDGTNGNDNNDGSSWSQALKTVQAGVSCASSYFGEVWVKAGTYQECITLDGYESVYGGFAGNEVSRDARDWNVNKTILDGGGAGSVVTDSGASGWGPQVIDGFTIRNGHATTGGGICCSYCSLLRSDVSGAALTISNNTITQNAGAGVGGGIYSSYSSLAIIGNTIEQNNAGGDGGGIYCEGTPDVTISHNIIRGNICGAGGGGIYSNASPRLVDNLIVGNTGGRGGGLYSGDYLYVINNTFAENTAGNSNGDGGAVYCDYPSAFFENNIIAFNSSGICSGVSPEMRCNDVYNPAGYNYTGFSVNASNISADPGFVNRPTGDFHLQAGSPCAFAGLDWDPFDDGTDLGGRGRPMSVAWDLGAYQSEGPVFVSAISQVKRSAIGQTVQMPSKPITAAFPGAFYIEEPGRFNGLRVISSRSVTPGDFASVTGQLTRSGGELAVQASVVSVSSGSVSDIPGALFVSNAAAGGGDFFWSSTCGQKGMTSSCGLSNIGLLVRVWGRVTEIGTDCLYIDDGSNWSQGNRSGDPAHIGVMVVCDPSSYKQGECLGVTGISSCYTTAGGQIYPRILTRGPGDIQGF